MNGPDFVRRAFILGAGGALAGCANMGTVGLMYRTIREIGDGKGEGYSRTRAEVDAVPYAQIGVSRGEGPRAVLVLSQVLGDELSWVSGNRTQIITHRNRVVRTIGLSRDLSGSEFDGPDLADRYQPGQTSALPGMLSRSVRTEPGNLEPVDVRSTFEIEGEERIEVLGQALDTLRVREDLDCKAWRWRVSNYWWLSRESRLAWRSLQHLTPDQPPLHIEVLKRYA